MKTIHINPKNPAKTSIEAAVSVLKKGGILMYPTDTCYGLGADISNKYAISKIYKIKKRSKNKPLTVIVPDIKTIKDLAIIKNYQEYYIHKYLPGAITLIFITLDQQVFPFSSIGIRIPNYRITSMISKEFNFAYITTSANVGNYPPTYEVKDFLAQLGKNDLKPDLILDAGRLPNNPPSTIIDLTSNNPKILRQGAIYIK